MSVTWEKSDVEHFRELGITIDDAKPKAGAYIVVSALLFWGVLTGTVLYGLLWLAAWVLRALGVAIHGV